MFCCGLVPVDFTQCSGLLHWQRAILWLPRVKEATLLNKEHETIKSFYTTKSKQCTMCAYHDSHCTVQSSLLTYQQLCPSEQNWMNLESEYHTMLIPEFNLKMSAAWWWPFYVTLNVLLGQESQHQTAVPTVQCAFNNLWVLGSFPLTVYIDINCTLHKAMDNLSTVTGIVPTFLGHGGYWSVVHWHWQCYTKSHSEWCHLDNNFNDWEFFSGLDITQVLIWFQTFQFYPLYICETQIWLSLFPVDVLALY